MSGKIEEPRMDANGREFGRVGLGDRIGALLMAQATARLHPASAAPARVMRRAAAFAFIRVHSRFPSCPVNAGVPA